MKKISGLVLLFVFATSLTNAQNIEQVRRAMRDEIKRSLQELQVASLQKPYYIEYTLTIRQSNKVKATLGSLVESSSVLVPRLTVGIRVGKPEFDNTNFFDVSLSFFGSSDDEENFKNRRVPMELDYNSFRRELWLASDACYKQAVELYAKKESSVKNRSRLDTTYDFTLLPPVTEIDTFAIPAWDKKRFEELVMVTSLAFTKHPNINASSVSMEYLPETVIYVNSEGREYVKTELQTGFEIVCSTQAADGMPLAQMYSAYAKHPNDLPWRDSLARAADMIATKLEQCLTSNTVEPYSGPVLFEGQAAAEVFAQMFAPYVATQRAPLTDRGIQDNDRYTAFQNKVGARVMAEFCSVYSIPKETTFNKTPLFGSFTLDDDGIRPEKLTLVDKGYLKTLLSSRIPTRRIKQSNGRQRGGAAMFDVLQFVCNDKKKEADHKELIKRMAKILKDRDLQFGYIVRKALNQNILYTTLFSQTSGDFPYSLGESTMNLLEVYKVFPDGREELVRGTQAAGMAPSMFKDLLAVGKTPYAYNFLAPAVTSPYISGGSQYLAASVIVPDLLFEDVEIRPLEGDFPKPPIMNSPMSTK